jgi:CheY-like chemotaxis protein
MPEPQQSAAAESYVLVVDDEEGVRESLCDLVQLVGCKAVAASNGAEALRLLRTSRPCLIILDLLMPVMSGQEMLAAMRDQPDLASLPVVISTSAPSRAPKGVPVIPKPIDVDLMWDWIRRTCQCAENKPARRI